MPLMLRFSRAISAFLNPSAPESVEDAQIAWLDTLTLGEVLDMHENQELSIPQVRHLLNLQAYATQIDLAARKVVSE